MKRKFLKFKYIFLAVCVISLFITPIYAQKVHTTYLWHMDQPVYWADKSKDKPDSKQFVEESQRLKMSGGNMYPGSSVSHPTNNLEEIFTKDDRRNAYQSVPRDAVSSIKDLPNAGAQLSISAGLMENIQSLGAKNQWGYGSGWMNPYKEANSWKTSGNFPRLDIVGFTYDHALSPLVSERTLIKQIQAHQYASGKYYGFISKGYWPAECAFSERIIKALQLCNIQWSVIANSHLARTLSDYTHPYNINGNVDAPNKADMVSTTGNNWYSGMMDGRGSTLAAPYCYQAHKAQYIDPATGTSYQIDVVPMCNFISYEDGFGTHGTSGIAANIEPYSNTTQPSIILMAHDGDNAWGGGSSYYNESVTGFTHGAASVGYEPTTIQQFLNDHPVPISDVVKVEDGAWVNADSDWGHPQFINWIWPLYSKTNYRFDPNGWTEDARNWAVITATENYVTMAEDLEGGNLRINYIADGGSSATNAEKAWHFYFGGLNSGFMYYGKAEDMEVKPSMTGNIAIDYAQQVINSKPNVDNTPPSVFIPQRFPYNPGGYLFGPTTGYKKIAASSDFDVWTYAYDVSGLTSVTLKYRIDKDGDNPVNSIQNEIYADGSEVESWQDIAMTRKAMATDPVDPELNFFILPKAKADLCYAEIAGLKDKLVDYYVEAVDTKGNIFKTPIQHVYIGSNDGGGGTSSDVSWEPIAPTNASTITITSKSATATSLLHWGVNGTSGSWTTPNAAYQPSGTIAATGGAVQTPFVNVNGVWQVTLGPFNNPAQVVSSVNFVIKHSSTVWDNNNGSNYNITVTPVATDNPTGTNVTKSLNENATYTFAVADFGFASSKGNTFKGIKILSLPASGTLKVNGTVASVDQLVTDVTKLVYTISSASSSFTYKIIDSADLISDANYTATFNLNSTSNAITLKFKKPTDWGASGVNLWAWNTGGNLFASWPGTAMTDDGNGWYSYTFNSSVTTVNAIFSKNGSPQSVDITGITASTCYEYDAVSGTKFTVKTATCPNTGLFDNNVVKQISVFPQPAREKFFVNMPNTGDLGKFTLKILDMSGKTIQTNQFEGETAEIPCGDLKSGVYIIRISNESRTTVYTSKLVKI